MEAEQTAWDFFIAHSSKDTALAEQLYEYLTGSARVFLDVRSLEPGMDWDTELAAAQRQAKATVVLVSAHTDAAYYQRVEIRQAIDLARPPGAHVVVPLITASDAKDGLATQYGLSLKQSLTLSAALSLEAAALRLLGILRRMQFSVVLYDSSQGAADHFRGYNNSFWKGKGAESHRSSAVSEGALEVELGGVLKLTRATTEGRLEAQLMDRSVAAGKNTRRIFEPVPQKKERSVWIRFEGRTDGTRQAVRLVLKCDSADRWLASERRELRSKDWVALDIHFRIEAHLDFWFRIDHEEVEQAPCALFLRNISIRERP